MNRSVTRAVFVFLGFLLVTPFLLPHTAHAQFPPPPSYEPTFSIEYARNGISVASGGTYDFPFGTSGLDTYIWPGTLTPNFSYGLIFRGTLHNSIEDIAGPFLGSFGPSQQFGSSFTVPGQYTVVVYNLTFHNFLNDPNWLYTDWFRHGTSSGTNVYPDARPSNQWGYLTFTLAPKPTLALSAASSTITKGATTTLTWSSTSADTCTASNGWSGAKVHFRQRNHLSHSDHHLHSRMHRPRWCDDDGGDDIRHTSRIRGVLFQRRLHPRHTGDGAV